jgi:predicted histone-like DNA-binding protein
LTFGYLTELSYLCIVKIDGDIESNKKFNNNTKIKLNKIMALKVKAQEKLQKIGTHAGKYRYVMMPELYTSLSQDKVIKEAALRSGVSKGIMQACWDAAGEVIKAWATEGHSVALPGLGTMRFGLRAKSVASAEEVKAGLISTRRIIFTPTVDLKDELASTAIQITCYDRTGKEVKRVTSTDPGTVEDPENENQNGSQNQNQGGGSQNQGGNQGGNTGGGGGEDDDVTYD